MTSKEDLERLCDEIKNICGIELTWSEKVALSNYYKCCYAKAEKEDEGTYKELLTFEFETLNLFLRDYFDLDIIDLGACKNKRIKERKIGEGPGLLRTPELKEYCRRHVQEWRNERELI